MTAPNVTHVDPARAACRIHKSWKYSGNSRQPVLGRPKTKRADAVNLTAEAFVGLDLDRPPGELLFHTQAGPDVPIL